MASLQPLPENIPFSDRLGITRRWMGWLRSIQASVSSSIDTEVLAAFSEIQRSETAGVADQAALEVFDSGRPQPFDSADLDRAAALLPAIVPADLGPIEILAELVPWPRAWSDLQAWQDTFANRTKYPAAAYAEGSFFRATDRLVVWQKQTIAGTAVWVYAAGIWRDTLANIPTASLGTSDAGLLFEVTDYSHTLRWTGTAWVWADRDDHSRYVRITDVAPAGYGAAAWQICDGSTVACLNADGTTTNVTVPNYGTAAYLKLATAATPGPTAASGRTSSDSAGTPSGTNSNPSTGNDTDVGSRAAVGGGGDPLVALNPHVHPTTAPVFTGNALAGHDHGPNTLELRRTELLAYYRR